MPTNHIPQCCTSTVLEHFQGLHHLPGQLCHCIITPSEKKFFLEFNLNLPCGNWRPFPLVPLLLCGRRGQLSTLPHLPFRWLWRAMWSSLNLLFTRLNNLSSINHCVLHWHHSQHEAGRREELVECSSVGGFYKHWSFGRCVFLLETSLFLGLSVGFFPRFWRGSRFGRNLTCQTEGKCVFQSSLCVVCRNRFGELVMLLEGENCTGIPLHLRLQKKLT